jgi:tRNA modification GTPase
MNDTIVAISTALGVGAISIIRLSGEDAIKIVSKLFKEKNLEEVTTHTIHYGHIIDNNEIIDEVLVMIMRSPRSFTTENVVEINCHGGIATTNKVLELVLSNGARLAEPGEFTKRAFLNGRIDLIEAEGVMDLIESKTEKARKLAINQIDGKVSVLIKNLRDKILDIRTNIAVNIDYPEYEDILVITNNMIKEHLGEIKQEINIILKQSENSKIIKEGINVVIIGRPNVGKSSLLNKLIEEDKAIVTDIEGTTRDIVEGSINLDGIIINFIDTAGIRKTENIIEKIGVEKSLNLISEADLIILVLNNNEEVSNEDLELINKTNNKKRIIFINKSDLNSRIDVNKISNEQIVYGNTINDNGLISLKNKIKEMFNFEELEGKDLTYLSNARQIATLKETLKVTGDIELSLKNNVPIDIYPRI